VKREEIRPEIFTLLLFASQLFNVAASGKKFSGASSLTNSSLAKWNVPKP